MSRRRVCDPCSVRRIKCDGQVPCAGCVVSALDCTKLRLQRKSGPKGIREKTLKRLAAVKQLQNPAQESPSHVPLVDALTGSAAEQEVLDPPFSPSNVAVDWSSCLPTGEWYESPSAVDANDPLGGASWPDSHVQTLAVPPSMAAPFKMSLEVLMLYLDIYHHKMFPIWPVVDRATLVLRLQFNARDVEAYILAASVCAATVLQLQLAASSPGSNVFDPAAVTAEIEDLRQAHDYRYHPTLETMCASFFLHVTYLHLGKQSVSTLLLREAISMAHMLDLHRPSHYEGLAEPQTQDHLRKMWLLFITERAHATQYDLPCTLTIPSDLPHLSDAAHPFMLSAFTLLCKMFQSHNEASTTSFHTASSLSALHSQLQRLPGLASSYNAVQRADVGVTRQWLRLHLWKLAISRITMTANSDNDLQSILFPVHVTRDLLASISGLTIDTLEAHGAGMELKLFEFANTMADIIVCRPPEAPWNMSSGLRDSLASLASVLGSFRGGNAALLPLLQSRLAEVGMNVPAAPRIMDVSYDSSGSPDSKLLLASDDSQGGTDDTEQY